MFNNDMTPAIAPSTELTEAQNRIAELEKQLADKTSMLNGVTMGYENLKRRMDAARDIVKDLIDDEVIDDMDVIVDLNKHMRLELREKVTVQITYTTAVEVEVDLGTEVSEHDFSVELSWNSEWLSTYEENIDIDVEERKAIR